MSLFCKIYVLWMLLVSAIGPVPKRRITASSVKDLHDLFNYFELTTLHRVSGNLNRAQPNLEAHQTNSIYFNAFGRTFQLSLSESELLSQPIIQIYDAQGLLKEYSAQDKYDSSGLYEGQVKGENQSKVLGYFLDGAFSGTVETGNSTYFVEPSWKYFSNTSSPLSVVVYRDDDVKYKAFGNKRMFLGDELTFANDGNEYKTASTSKNNLMKLKWQPLNSSATKWSDKMCMIELVADHTLYNYMAKSADDTIKTLLFYAKKADAIFRQTDFDEDGTPDELRLIVGKIVVITDPRVPGYNLGSETADSKEFIFNFSRRVQDFCVSVCLCHRDFDEGVVGLAYRADPDNYRIAGGICQHPVRTANGEKYTPNTAVVSSLSKNTNLPLAISSSSFVHEIGHSFGSSHDPEDHPLCSPGGNWGNYLMTPFTIDGSKPHHNMFSPCSKTSIKRVIEKRGICLETKKIRHCGNGITEDGEECDCGTEATCHFIDPCCAPRGGLGEDKECTFRKTHGYQCSWVDSACCDKNCRIVSSEVKRLCTRDASICRESMCNGISAECPVGEWKVDGSPCKGMSHTCRGGMCNSTVCLDAGLQDCSCEVNPPEGNECHVCCFNVTSNACIPAELFGYTTPDGHSFVKYPGTSCNHGKGKCDVRGRCVMAQSSGKGVLRIKWPTKTWPNVLMTAVCVLMFTGTGILCYRQHPLFSTVMRVPQINSGVQRF